MQPESHSVISRALRSPRTVTGIVALAALAGTAVHAALSPRISALLIRAVFTRGAQRTAAEMHPYAPATGIAELLDLDYGVPGSGASLDLFTPQAVRLDTDTTATNESDGEAAPTALPTVVWIHGGAWISGTRVDLRPYLRILASRGYTTVGLSYPIAPEQRYPDSLAALNDALGYLIDNAAELRIDPTRIVLAGDSAGAQLASQLAAAVTSADYARSIQLVPALDTEQLKGVVLQCGIYDLDALSELSGITSWGLKTALWAYLGIKDWDATPEARAMSTIHAVTGAFTPTFVSGGNGDPLTPTQSRRMAERLKTAGVDVTELFWPDDHKPALGHEYQFHLDLPEARDALEQTVDFLDRVTAR